MSRRFFITPTPDLIIISTKGDGNGDGNGDGDSDATLLYDTVTSEETDSDGTGVWWPVHWLNIDDDKNEAQALSTQSPNPPPTSFAPSTKLEMLPVDPFLSRCIVNAPQIYRRITHWHITKRSFLFCHLDLSRQSVVDSMRVSFWHVLSSSRVKCK